jgi:hypothetical protein
MDTHTKEKSSKLSAFEGTLLDVNQGRKPPLHRHPSLRHFPIRKIAATAPLPASPSVRAADIIQSAGHSPLPDKHRVSRLFTPFHAL